jgi:protein-S-isoprenylcysteine O-methyltransferase Ste14
MISLLARRRTTFFPLAAAFMLIFGHPNWASFAIGISVVAIGEGIRFWAAGHIRKCVELSADGPFGCVRNPLYFGSFVMAIGFSVMGDNLLIALVAMALFCLLHGSAIACEERYLSGVFGEKFDAYCKSVPRILPKWPRRGSHTYSFRLAIENREHISSVFAAIISLIFAARILMLK